MDKVFWVRQVVFVDEQQVPLEMEIDEFEDNCTHFLAEHEGKPVGAGRVRELSGYGKIERICVLDTCRGLKGGVAIMAAIETEISLMGLTKCKLEAQVHAIPFYEKLGYEIRSEVFMDAGIPHRLMVKNLS